MTIEELEIFTFVGVYDSEQREKQKVLVTLELEIPLIENAAGRDDLSLTVDWDDVCNTVTRVADERPRRLIDTLAHDIASGILKTHRIVSATVRVKKLIRSDTKGLSIAIKRLSNSELM